MSIINEDRHKDRRRAARVEIRFEVGGQPIGSGVSRDISVSGMYIELSKPPREADLARDVLLSFRMPEDDALSLVAGVQIQTRGRIVRVDRTPGGPVGVGIEFEDLTQYDFWAIEECVRLLSGSD